MKIFLVLLFSISTYSSFSQVGYGGVDPSSMQYLNDTLRKDTANVELLYLRGMSFLENKVYDSALIDFTKGLKYFSRKPAEHLIPDKEDFINGRAEAFAATARWDDAMNEISLLQKMQPGNYMYSALHLRLLLKYGNFELAQKEISKMKMQKGTEEKALVWQAELYHAMDKDEEAMHSIDTALKKYPKSVEGLMTKADLLFRQKRYNTACLYLSKAQALLSLKYYGGDEFYYNNRKQAMKIKKSLFCH